MRLLARTFGIPAGELMERLGVEEFLDHWADYCADPWGETRADLRSGLIAALLYNVNRGRDQAPKDAGDFVLYRSDPPDEAAARERFFAQQRRR